MQPPFPLDFLPRCDLGEGPHWDIESQTLYWVDITGQRIHRWSLATDVCESYDVGSFVGFVVVDSGGRPVAGLRDGIYELAFDALQAGAPRKRLVARPDMDAHNRFNDGACDPRGRLWAGTMHVSGDRDRLSGALYRLADEGLETMQRDIGIANGLGWSPDGGTMYFAETHRGIIWAYRYDIGAGRTSDRRVFAEVPIDVGVPDGLTVDSAGNVYVAIWRGHRINIYAPDGQLDRTIAMPVPHATSCCFGGPDLRTLYISTSASGLSADELVAYPHSGLIFAWAAGTPGLPATRMHPILSRDHGARSL